MECLSERHRAARAALGRSLRHLDDEQAMRVSDRLIATEAVVAGLARGCPLCEHHIETLLATEADREDRRRLLDSLARAGLVLPADEAFARYRFGL